MNSDVEVTLLVAGPRENIIRLVEKFQPPPTVLCLAEDGSGAHERYRVRVTPFAFMIGRDGRILAKGLCDSAMRLQQLFVAGGQEVPNLLEVI